MSFDPKLLDGLLVCPRTKQPLVHDGEALISVDPNSRLKFAIVDGIPNLLLDDAETLSPEAWSAVMARQGRDPATGNALGH